MLVLPPFIGTSQGEHRSGPVWTGLGDIDIFVAGRNGSTGMRFRAFVWSVVSNLKDRNRHIESLKWYSFKVYGRRRRAKIVVCDVRLADIGTKLSFVQSPGFDVRYS